MEPRTERGKEQQDVNLGYSMEPRTECGQRQDANMEDYGIAHSNDDNVRLPLATEDVRNATYLPTARWPPFRDGLGCAPPAPLLCEESQTHGLAALDPKTTYSRAAGRDIVSKAPAAAGDAQVDPVECFLMDEKGDLFSPGVGLGFVVYRIPSRFVWGHYNFNGPWGVHFRPRAHGSPTQRARAPKNRPPGTRKASPREVIQFLENPLQMGCPASTNTDA